MRKLLLLAVALMLSSSALKQHVVTFEEPIDAISVRLPHDNAKLSIWTDDGWHALSIEKEFDPLLLESDLVLFDTSVSEVVFKGDISNIELHPIRISSEPASYELAATSFYRTPRILQRHQWGANDEFLVRGPNVERSDEPSSTGTVSSAGSTSSKRQDDCEIAQRDYPQDFAVEKTMTHDASGNRLRWARRYSPDVKLLVVHHTALRVTGDNRSPIERMRALYEYHANGRGWGDVGYHYIVDEQGGIYEGRSGGESVVGGHVYCGNVGTVGVALMGNFETEQPTQQQIQSLQWLLDHLADAYHIDLNTNVVFKGKQSPPIVRHKDLISTECPGFYLSNVIAQIRNNVKKGDLLASVTFPKIATTSSRQNRIEQRITARLEEAGQALSRNFYRAKRLMRTAERQDSTKIQFYRQQLEQGSNLQRLRAAQEARRQARTQPPTTQKLASSISNPIRIRLSYTGTNAEVTSSTLADVNGNQAKTVRFGKDGSQCIAVDGNATLGEGIVRMNSNGGVLTVNTWNTSYNRFRGSIECRVIDGELVLINELSLEDYMAGLGEEPDTEPYEKQRAFAIAARSYAAHYMQPANRKFPGKPYDGDDSPARFQQYLGYAFEQQHDRWTSAVASTAKQVLMKDGDIIKAAYFSSNDGRTRSPDENGWKNFPHAEVFASKPDPWCAGMELRGHGVGMSGCGAEGQAEDGKTAEQILQYYYTGTTVKQLP